MSAKNVRMEARAGFSLFLLCVGLIATLTHLISTKHSSDPFLSTQRVSSLKWLIYLNLGAVGLLGLPQEPRLATSSILVLIAYLVTILRVNRQASLIRTIEQEYFSYSLPSKRSTTESGLRRGHLNRAEVALRLQLFVKEGMQFERLSKTSSLLILQSWAGLIFFVISGFQNTALFALFLLSTILIIEITASIATKATLHPGQQSKPELAAIKPEPAAPEIEDSAPSLERVRPRRKLLSSHSK